jgi:hypothetical protein
MIKLKLQGWRAPAALLMLTLFARALVVDAAVSATPDPVEATILDTATGAVCDERAASTSRSGGVVFAAADPGMPLAITSLEIHFAAERAWDEVRVRAEFQDSAEPPMTPGAAIQARTIREISLGARPFADRRVNTETLRLEQPVTLTAAAFHAVVLSLEGRRNGVWTDASMLSPCLRLGARIGPDSAGRGQQDTDADSAVMLKIFGWLSPPPTRHRSQADGDPTPVPLATAMVFVLAVWR